MPELPDVEYYRQYLESTSLHKNIVDTEVREPSLVEGASVQEFRQSLKHKRMTDTARHGKYLLINLDGQLWMVMHFGMTGALCYYRQGDPEPARTKVRFTFDTGYHLAFTSIRNLGRVSLITSPQDFIRARQLGPDALSQKLDFTLFYRSLNRKKGMIKTALMDQSTIAGIGNIYSDEILFQAGINPARHLECLREDQLRNIFMAMKKVLKTAIRFQADPSLFPDACLLPRRESGGRCPRCGSELKTRKISGRTSFFCPRCQPEPARASSGKNSGDSKVRAC
ncbi:MAG TPA: DNA-formamidopyrimidine glycosylase family protein [Deltaproteobacteria bacterium]|nr:DNA-formamidopyrimidine glycosylase family protein [Deltaproteobacteria bacterium]